MNVLFDRWSKPLVWQVGLQVHVLCMLGSIVATPTTSDSRLPLGAHRSSEGTISQVEGFLNPETFFNDYVRTSKPVLFKGAARNIPAYHSWTDAYLEKQYGRVPVDVEMGKKETRSQPLERLPFAQFLNAYKTEDIYMVQDVVATMKGDLSLPKCLQCGGFQHLLEAAVIWFSSGGTKSVLHLDEVDNINCLLDGSKSLLMIDREYDEEVTSRGFVHQGGYSKVDVESVDEERFPQLSSLPWWEAKMEKGDCLYIPYKWFHTVDSAIGRNLAVNLWFVHLLWLNQTDCESRAELLKEADSMSNYKISTDMEDVAFEKVRFNVFEVFEGKESVSFEDAMEMWELSPEEAEGVFEMVDRSRNLELEWDEMYSVDVMALLQDFPFLLPDYAEAMEESEDMEEELDEKDEL